MKTDKFCQSCGMPLDKVVNGTEKDGNLSTKYCPLCYKDGEFIEKDITYNEMLNRGIEGLKNQDINSFKKKMMIKYYPKMLKQLDRWKE